MPDNLQQALVNAVDTMIDAATRKLEFDKTIECEIVRPADASTGEYKVRYLNGTFSAYDSSLKMQYKAGQIVYVQIPKNNMSEKKLILGKKSTNAVDLIDATQDDEKVDKVGIPFDEIYQFDRSFSNEHGIYGSTTEGGYHLIYNPTITSMSTQLFQEYAKDKQALIIQADFKTDWYIPNSINAGNYGIEIYFNNVDGTMSRYVLDRKNMIGNSLNYSNWETNYAILQIDGNNLKNIDHVCFYSENFKRTDGMTEQNLVDRFNSGDKELFVRNITIQFCQPIDRDGYTVVISPLDGQYINDKNSLRLQAVLKYNGSPNPIDQAKASYYWYERDAQVSIVSDYYDELAGVCWKKIDEGSSLLNISRSEFVSKGILQKTYKVVVLYEEYKATNTIDIYASVADVGQYEMQLYKSADGRTGDLIVTPQTSGYTTTWLSVDANGVDQVEESNENFALRGIDTANIVGGKTFYCTIYLSGVPIYTLSQTVYNETIVKDFDVQFNVDNGGIFYYNEKGDLPQGFSEVKNIDFSIILNGAEKEFTYTYEWKYPDAINADSKMFTISPSSNMSGTELTPDKSISFTIDRRFYREKSEDNIIQLVIVADGVTYNFYKELQFIKQGDPGTNGTSLLMTVKYSGGNKAILANGSTRSSINIQIQMYYNGKASYNGQNVNSYFNFATSVPNDYKYGNPLASSYSAQNFFGENQILSATLSVPAVSFNTSTPNSIIQIAATPKSSSGPFPYKVFYLLPLAQARTTEEQTYEYLGPTIVMYDEQGYDPSFDETVPKVIKANGEIVSSIFTALGTLTIQEGVITPPAKFDPYKSYMAVTTTNYIQPIVGTLNAFSKSILNQWDGSSLEINSDGSYILASQIGAGTKDNNNRFSGVLMGILNEGGTTKTGLMGFNAGVSTFGFMSDGSAYIGKSGAGRIEFVPSNNKVLLQSANFSSQDGTGMQIDLTEALITADKFKLKSSALTVDSTANTFNFDTGTSGYFRIRDTNKKVLFYAANGNDNYYLQSANYSAGSSTTNGAGTKIDLNNGRFYSWNLYLRTSSLTIDSSNNTFSFDTSATGSFQIRTNDSTRKTLFYAGNNSYYLRSSNYSSTEGMNINLQTGAITCGNGFSVSSTGALHATSATIDGNTVIGGNATFKGSLDGASGSFSGTVTASAGKIGGWYINSSGISSSNSGKGNAYLYSDGSFKMGDKNTGLEFDGSSLTAWNLEIGGSNGAAAVGALGVGRDQNNANAIALVSNDCRALSIMAGGNCKVAAGQGRDCTGTLYFYDSDNDGVSLSQLRKAVFG